MSETPKAPKMLGKEGIPKMSEFDNLDFCFICSKITEEDEESFQKNQTLVVGTLCQLLNLPLRDNTLNFGIKFQQTRFCFDCKLKIKGYNKILEELKVLENQVLEGRKRIENELRRSYQKQGEFLKLKSKMSGKNGMTLPRTTMIQDFREEIVGELSKSNQWSAWTLRMRSRSSSGPCEKCNSIGPEVLASKPSLFGKLPLPKLEIDTSSQGLLSPIEMELKYSPITPPRVSDQKVDVSSIPLEIPEEMDRSGSGSGEESDDDEVEEDEDSDGNADAKFITSTKVEIGGAVSKFKNRKKNVTVRGLFQCAFAPKCDLIFKKNERLKFLAHLREFHDAEVVKVIQPADIVISVKMEDEKTVTKEDVSTPTAESVPELNSSASVPNAISVPNSVPDQKFVQIQNPVSVPNSGLIQNSVSMHNSVPIQNPALIKNPVPVENSLSIKNSVPFQNSVPVQITVPVQNSLPTQNFVPASVPAEFVIQFPGPAPKYSDSPIVTNYSCEKCGTFFSKKYNLTRHQQRYHSIDIRMSPSKKSSPTSTKSRKRKKHLSGSSSTSVSVTGIPRKRQLHISPTMIKVEDEKPEKSELDSSIGNTYKCDICGDCYFFKADLTRHIMMTHESGGEIHKGGSKGVGVGVYNNHNLNQKSNAKANGNGDYKIIWQRR